MIYMFCFWGHVTNCRSENKEINSEFEVIGITQHPPKNTPKNRIKMFVTCEIPGFFFVIYACQDFLDLGESAPPFPLSKTMLL